MSFILIKDFRIIVKELKSLINLTAAVVYIDKNCRAFVI